MRGIWTFERAQKEALKNLRGGMDLKSETVRFGDLISAADAVPQMFAHAPDRTVSRTRNNEFCVLSSGPDVTPFLSRIHISWRYVAFCWYTHIRRAEQLAEEFPKKAMHRSLPIGDIDFINASCILRTMAIAAVLGEDEAHDWFGNRCLQMIESDEPFVDPEAWTVGPVQPFLTWLFCRWRYDQDRFKSLTVADLGPFQCVVDAWDDPTKLDDAIVSVCDLHLRKIREILKPDDDFIFGLAVGLGYFIPFEVLYLQRIRRELGLSVPKPSHPFLDQPMAQIPCPCPKSGYDPFMAKAYALCRETMPELNVPWETAEQADESNTNWLEEIDFSTFRIPKIK